MRRAVPETSELLSRAHPPLQLLAFEDELRPHFLKLIGDNTEVILIFFSHNDHVRPDPSVQGHRARFAGPVAPRRREAPRTPPRSEPTTGAGLQPSPRRSAEAQGQPRGPGWPGAAQEEPGRAVSRSGRPRS